MSYLPLAHIYERTNQVVSVYYGVAIGFYQGVRDALYWINKSLIAFLTQQKENDFSVFSYSTSVKAPYF